VDIVIMGKYMQFKHAMAYSHTEGKKRNI
jgi:hypothetical protein